MRLAKSEQEILAMIHCGEQEGLKYLFDLYYKPLCVFAMNFLNSAEESEDVVQELFVRFWEKQTTESFEGSLRAYLFSSVQHNCIKLIKRKKRYPALLLEACEDLPVYSEEEVEIECKKLYDEINRLPEQCRKVFELIVFKDMRYKEVAQTLHLSVNTVKTHFSRALRQLRNVSNLLLFILLLKYPKEA